MFERVNGGVAISSVPMLQFRIRFSTQLNVQPARSRSEWEPQIWQCLWKHFDFLLFTNLPNWRIEWHYADFSLRPLVIRGRANTRKESAKVRNRRAQKKVLLVATLILMVKKKKKKTLILPRLFVTKRWSEEIAFLCLSSTMARPQSRGFRCSVRRSNCMPC